jgi:hypothetical protein
VALRRQDVVSSPVGQSKKPNLHHPGPSVVGDVGRHVSIEERGAVVWLARSTISLMSMPIRSAMGTGGSDPLFRFVSNSTPTVPGRDELDDDGLEKSPRNMLPES